MNTRVPPPQDAQCRSVAIACTPMVTFFAFFAFAWCLHVGHQDEPLALHHCSPVPFVSCAGARVVTELVADKWFCHVQRALLVGAITDNAVVGALDVRPMHRRTSFIMPAERLAFVLTLYCNHAPLWTCNITTEPLAPARCGTNDKRSRLEDDDDDTDRRPVPEPLTTGGIWARVVFSLAVAVIGTWLFLYVLVVLLSCCCTMSEDIDIIVRRRDTSHDTV